MAFFDIGSKTDLLDDVRLIAEQVLGRRPIAPQLAERSGGTGESWLFRYTAESITAQDDQLGAIPVLPISVNNRAPTLYVAIRLTFSNKNRDRYLLSNSVQVFEGTATGEKRPLFRAEWDSRQDGNHGQPHWHVPPAITDAPGRFDAFRRSQVPSFERNVRTPLPTTWYGERMGFFHFAMSAAWHLPCGGCQLPPGNATQVGNWIRGCLAYVRDEFDYVQVR